VPAGTLFGSGGKGSTDHGCESGRDVYHQSGGEDRSRVGDRQAEEITGEHG
jgi:hypothetical protein